MEPKLALLRIILCFTALEFCRSSPMNVVKTGDKSEETVENMGILSPSEYLPEENENNDMIYEGDIYLDDSTINLLMHLKRRTIRSAISAPHRKWPDATIPYEFGYVNSAVKSAVKHAIRAFEKHTCIRFVPRTNEKDYVYFLSYGKSCWSPVGRSGGKQRISLGLGCERKGNVIHEMMHAIGFFHEQSRIDRDNYVTVYWSNIEKDQEINFQKYSHGEADSLDLPYDYGSIMHYPKYAFSRNGYPTLVPKKRNIGIGQRFGLSKIDVKKINKFYNCSAQNRINTTKTTVSPTTERKTDHSFVSHCRNRSLYCKLWARVGYCKHANARYQVYMASNCRKSCDLC